MGFYIRKYINLGVGRVNISKSGLGFSAGRPGARFGIDSQGKRYIHLGRKGIYYKTFIGQKQSNDTASTIHSSPVIVLLVGLSFFVIIVIALILIAITG